MNTRIIHVAIQRRFQNFNGSFQTNVDTVITKGGTTQNIVPLPKFAVRKPIIADNNMEKKNTEIQEEDEKRLTEGKKKMSTITKERSRRL